MRINVAVSSLVSLPLIADLAQKKQLNKIYIPKNLLVFEEHLRSQYTQIDIQKCTAKFTRENDLSSGADLLLVFGFPYLIKPIPHKTFNIHFGELPENRGPEPLFWTLKQGKKIAYVTIHQLDRSFDTGPVYSQKGYPIMPRENQGILHARLGNLVLAQIQSFIENIGEPEVQDEVSARYYTRPEDQDLHIDWQTMSALQIENLVRACNPNYIGARTSFKGVPIQLVEVFIHSQFELTEEQKTKKPGQVILSNQQGLAVLTADLKALFITVAHMNEGTFSALKLIQMGINEQIKFL